MGCNVKNISKKEIKCLNSFDYNDRLIGFEIDVETNNVNSIRSSGTNYFCAKVIAYDNDYLTIKWNHTGHEQKIPIKFFRLMKKRMNN